MWRNLKAHCVSHYPVFSDPRQAIDLAIYESRRPAVHLGFVSCGKYQLLLLSDSSFKVNFKTEGTSCLFSPRCCFSSCYSVIPAWI